MTQRDRDRLVVLKKAQKKLITQRQAAGELQLSERQVRRLMVRLREVGDRAVIHGLRQRLSNRRLSEDVAKAQCEFCPSRCIGSSGRRWPASIWLRNTGSDRAGSVAAVDAAAGLWRASRKRRSRRSINGGSGAVPGGS